MNDGVALAAFSSALFLPFIIYIAGKFSSRVSQVAYRLLGVFCLLVATGFFAFVGWYFLTTGQLVSPGKYGIPTRIVGPADSPGLRVFVGTFNLLVGFLLAFFGVLMLRVGHKSDSSHSGEV